MFPRKFVTIIIIGGKFVKLIRCFSFTLQTFISEQETTISVITPWCNYSCSMDVRVAFSKLKALRSFYTMKQLTMIHCPDSVWEVTYDIQMIENVAKTSFPAWPFIANNIRPSSKIYPKHLKSRGAGLKLSLKIFCCSDFCCVLLFGKISFYPIKILISLA